MGRQTWNMESAINFRLEELKLEYEYWKDVCKIHAEQAKQRCATNPSMEDLILVQLEADYMDLAYTKIEALMKKLSEIKN